MQNPSYTRSFLQGMSILHL